MKAKIKEIVKTKRYRNPGKPLYCISCPHCLHWFEYGDCERFYCLVDDEYKDNDSAQKDECIFNKANQTSQ